MRKISSSTVILILLLSLVTPGVAAQVPPEVLLDRYLVQAERLIAEQDYDAALDAMDNAAELLVRHNLAVPDEFHFIRARVALAAGVVDVAIESVTRYLTVVGRSGAFYDDALKLWDEAEAEARRQAEVEAEARRQAEVEAEARRQAEVEAEARRQAELESEERRQAALGPAVFSVGFEFLRQECPHARLAPSMSEANVVAIPVGGRWDLHDSRGNYFATDLSHAAACDTIGQNRRRLVGTKMGDRSPRERTAVPNVLLGGQFTRNDIQAFANRCSRVRVTTDLGLADFMLMQTFRERIGGRGGNRFEARVYDMRGGHEIGSFGTYRGGTLLREACDFLSGRR